MDSTRKTATQSISDNEATMTTKQPADKKPHAPQVRKVKPAGQLPPDTKPTTKERDDFIKAREKLYEYWKHD